MCTGICIAFSKTPGRDSILPEKFENLLLGKNSRRWLNHYSEKLDGGSHYSEKKIRRWLPSTIVKVKIRRWLPSTIVKEKIRRWLPSKAECTYTDPTFTYIVK